MINGTLYCGDNLDVLRSLYNESVDLVYLDPPFNKKQKFIAPVGTKAEGSSFKDTWEANDVNEEWNNILTEHYPILPNYLNNINSISHKSNKYYLTYFAIRIHEIHRVLKKTGSMYLHCDPTMSHYLKVLCDCIFGCNNFINEIIWCYKTGGSTNKNWAKKHDVILMYTINYKTKYFNNIKEKSIIKSSGFKRKDGTPIFVGKDENKNFYTYVNCRDYWIIDAVGRTSKERTGYPTQKPIRLLDKIIEASCPPNGVVLDPFCGSGTTLVSAEKNKRKWIGIDKSESAVQLSKERLELWKQTNCLKNE